MSNLYISKRLYFSDWDDFNSRVTHLSENTTDITPTEMLSSYLLDKLFWKKFGKGCHTLRLKQYKIQKKLWDGTYRSNSGKTRMGSFTPYFEITNIVTGKVREIGTKSVEAALNRRTNRRNDPDRNFGLPNSRGYS
jgi:hypothetical protein